MIDMECALQRIMQEVSPLAAQVCALPAAISHVLAQPVTATTDTPPFTKSLVDGFAIPSGELQSEAATFQLVGNITAGEWPQRSLHPGETVRVMTGAPTPDGADAVVPQEQLLSSDAGKSHVTLAGPVRLGQNLLNRGALYRQGEVVLPIGQCVRPPELALLAELGLQHISVIRSPRIALFATGDELTGVDEPVRDGTIRNSNGPLMQALCASWGGVAVDYGIVRDRADDLRHAITKAVQDHDVLLISGGVSVGLKDLVPDALTACQVNRRFHGVNMKPGKPLWFGVYEGTSSLNAPHRCLVFGLPGNPLSVFAALQVFVRVAVLMLRGFPAVPRTGQVAHPAEPNVHPLVNHPLGQYPSTGRLLQDHHHSGSRPTWVPCRYRPGGDGHSGIELVGWHGSADLKSLTQANGLALFSSEGHHHAGSSVAVLSW